MFSGDSGEQKVLCVCVKWGQRERNTILCVCFQVWNRVFRYQCARESVCVCVKVCVRESVCVRERYRASALQRNDALALYNVCVPVYGCVCLRLCVYMRLCVCVCVFKRLPLIALFVAERGLEVEAGLSGLNHTCHPNMQRYMTVYTLPQSAETPTQ